MKFYILLMTTLLVNVACANDDYYNRFDDKSIIGNHAQSPIIYSNILMYSGLHYTRFSFVIDTLPNGTCDIPSYITPGTSYKPLRPFVPAPTSPTPIPAPHALLLGILGVGNTILARKRLR